MNTNIYISMYVKKNVFKWKYIYFLETIALYVKATRCLFYIKKRM